MYWAGSNLCSVVVTAGQWRYYRSADSMQKLPTVLYMAAGTPVWKPDDCNSTNFDQLRQSQVLLTLKTGKTGEREVYLRNGLNNWSSLRHVLSNNTLLYDFTFLQGRKSGNGGSSDQQSKAKTIPELYGHLPVMAQSVLSVGRYQCIGPYDNKFIKQADPHGHAWHPGAMGHRMRGHSIAYSFLGMMGTALEAYWLL